MRNSYFCLGTNEFHRRFAQTNVHRHLCFSVTEAWLPSERKTFFSLIRRRIATDIGVHGSSAVMTKVLLALTCHMRPNCLPVCMHGRFLQVATLSKPIFSDRSSLTFLQNRKSVSGKTELGSQKVIPNPHLK